MAELLSEYHNGNASLNLATAAPNLMNTLLRRPQLQTKSFLISCFN